ncbi:FRG domain-containing protein [Methanocorpusculum sp. CW153]|uniref:FRG domain-containing protein n=2 Tax=Methanocorpusculum vombati TaxID=3002864 RepID=A0ABT4IKZ7_9EURY|nr:FRG domain-containing protein [Methanocorpusculum vombati]MDE2520547.1 FRG domain-containing protein [Methanocorpusculum sp.]
MSQGKKIIVIETLTNYLQEISKMREKIFDDIDESSTLKDTQNFSKKDVKTPFEDDRQRFFFRGQENISWDIRPSIFRNGLLPSESQMITMAYSRNPAEFREYRTSFERLTKLQHYGLSTRLLDVTLNPMVALYFACQSHENIIRMPRSDKEKTIYEMTPCDGIVYSHRDYGHGFDSSEVKILSSIAEMDFDKNLTIKECLTKLVENTVVTPSDAKYYEKNEYELFIRVLQGNYFVISNFSNQRLIRQNGAFLLPGSINIHGEGDIGKRILQKAESNLRDEFTSLTFQIPADSKERILQELDLYGINESSLFPELEHQMKYISSQYQKPSIGMGETFSKICLANVTKQDEIDNSLEDAVHYCNPFDIDAETVIHNILKEWLPDGSLEPDVYLIFEKNMVVDWYKKESVISTIRSEIAHYLISSGKTDKNGSRGWSNIIMNKVIEDLKKSECAEQNMDTK